MSDGHVRCRFMDMDMCLVDTYISHHAPSSSSQILAVARLPTLCSALRFYYPTPSRRVRSYPTHLCTLASYRSTYPVQVVDSVAFSFFLSFSLSLSLPLSISSHGHGNPPLLSMDK